MPTQTVGCHWFHGDVVLVKNLPANTACCAWMWLGDPINQVMNQWVNECQWVNESQHRRQSINEPADQNQNYSEFIPSIPTGIKSFGFCRQIAKLAQVVTCGGWEHEIGGCRKCAAFFKQNPTRLHALLGQGLWCDGSGGLRFPSFLSNNYCLCHLYWLWLSLNYCQLFNLQSLIVKIHVFEPGEFDSQAQAQTLAAHSYLVPCSEVPETAGYPHRKVENQSELSHSISGRVGTPNVACLQKVCIRHVFLSHLMLALLLIRYDLMWDHATTQTYDYATANVDDMIWYESLYFQIWSESYVTVTVTELRTTDDNRVVPFRIISVNEQSRESLLAPLQFFIEVSTYTSVAGPPREGELSYKKMGGTTLAGDSWAWLNLTWQYWLDLTKNACTYCQLACGL